MQLPPFGIVLLALLIIGVVISIRSRKAEAKQKCTHCGSTKMVQINHETLSTKSVELQNGNFLPGADIRLQMVQDLTYHCEACNQRSTFRVTSTP